MTPWWVVLLAALVMGVVGHLTGLRLATGGYRIAEDEADHAPGRPWWPGPLTALLSALAAWAIGGVGDWAVLPTYLLFAWLTAASIGLRVSISLFLLPYNAVGAELSDDYAERSSIAAWRWGFGMLGAVLTVVLGFGVFLSGPGGLSRREAYLPFAISLAVLVAIGAAIAMRAMVSRNAIASNRSRERATPTATGKRSRSHPVRSSGACSRSVPVRPPIAPV